MANIHYNFQILKEVSGKFVFMASSCPSEAATAAILKISASRGLSDTTVTTSLSYEDVPFPERTGMLPEVDMDFPSNSTSPNIVPPKGSLTPTFQQSP